ncbi:MAG: flavodoxin family protein [Acidimicrobiia bacterium]
MLELHIVRTVLIYESLTGTTKQAAELIAEELRTSGAEATVCSVDEVDLAAVAQADLVVIGSWVDGLLIVGQRPGKAAKLRQLPVIDGKQAAVFCTYAINPGKTLHKLTEIVSDLGANVIGGVAIHRGAIGSASAEFAAQLLAKASPTT